MPVEFISATHTTPTTEASAGGRRPDLDVEYTRRFVHALDEGGFDYTLVAYGSPSADSLQVAQFVVNNSERIKPMVAHRPGFVFPTLAAKALATIDQIGHGRLGLHIISGGTDAEQRREGDYLNKPSATSGPTSSSRSCAGSGRDVPSASTARTQVRGLPSNIRPYRTRSRSPSAAPRGRLPGRRAAGRHLRAVG